MDAITRRLMRAYNRLQDKRAWIKGALNGDWVDGDDGTQISTHCLLGAVGIIDTAERVRQFSCRYFVIEAIKELFPNRMRAWKPGWDYTFANTPAYFNDHHKTKHADVLAVLRRSIELSEAHFNKKKIPEKAMTPDTLVVITSPWAMAR